MSIFKTILLSLIMVSLFASHSYSNPPKNSFDDLDLLNQEAVLLDKRLEIIKKQVELEKYENELKDYKKGIVPKAGFNTLPQNGFSSVGLPEGVDKITTPPIVAPAPVKKIEKNSSTFSESEIQRLPFVKSIHEFGEKKTAVLLFDNNKEQQVFRDQIFRVGSNKYFVTKIDIVGVEICKAIKGEKIVLPFINSQPDNKIKTFDFDPQMDMPPTPAAMRFLDSTSNPTK